VHDPLSQGKRGPHFIATVLRRGLRRRCPHCGQGPLFLGWGHHVEKCPVCGLVYERNPGDTWAFTGIGDRIPGSVHQSHLLRRVAIVSGVGLRDSRDVRRPARVDPDRWGVGIALHYLSRVYWPDPSDRFRQTRPQVPDRCLARDAALG
jgi:hypothetical protein